MLRKIHYVYKLVNKIDNKYYIGVRSCDGDPLIDKYYGSGSRIRNAVKKYGIESFSKEILRVCETREDAFMLEKDLVNDETLKDPFCYNLCGGGAGPSTFSSETREKMSISASLRFGELGSMYGKMHSEEHKRKMSELMRGHVVSEKTRIAVSLSNSNRVVTETTRAKLSEANRGKTISNSHKLAISKANTGRIKSDEEKRKIGAAHKGKTLSKEHIKALSLINTGNTYNLGSKLTEDHKRKISKSSKGRIVSDATRKLMKITNSHPQQKVTCPHCEFTGGEINMRRYHFDECKLRIFNTVY